MIRHEAWFVDHSTSHVTPPGWPDSGTGGRVIQEKNDTNMHYKFLNIDKAIGLIISLCIQLKFL